MEYSIRFAKKKDTDAIMKFIDTYWRKNHILSRDKQLFEWQYGNETDKLNIIIGVDSDNNIQGMLGFVKYGLSQNQDIALALWKANPATGFLGVKILKYLMENVSHREIVCPGINLKTTSKIYEHVGMKVGTMVQWYRLADRDEYLIAKVLDNKIPKVNNYEKKIKLKEVGSIDELREIFNFEADELQLQVPFKSEWYIEKRYFKHPIYRYKIYALVGNDQKATSIIVLRVQDCNDSHALRWIDYIGDYENISYITNKLDELMDELDCEYIDVYEAGIKDDILSNAGWLRVEESGNIIPDYFSPFEHRKVDIHYSTSNGDAVLFKGDGDQDRPN